jgi:tetratricopeptide (TPR) repeat protein
MALALDPTFVPAHVTLGKIAAEAGRIDLALRHFRASNELDPENAQVMADLGQVYLNANRLDEAMMMLRAAIGKKPRLVEARTLLAQAHLRRGEHEAALGQVEAALAVRRNWPPAIRLKAWILATAAEARLRNGAQAVALAQALVNGAPQPDPRLLDTLAAAHAEVGNFAAAVDAAAQAAGLAEKSGDQRLAAEIAARQQGYASGRPHREPAARGQ